MNLVILIIILVHAFRCFNQTYLGFIYPYVVLYENIEGDKRALKFLRLDKMITSKQILTQNQQKNANTFLVDGYQLFDDQFQKKLLNIQLQTIKVKTNSILVSYKEGEQYSLFMENYHLHLFNKINQNTNYGLNMLNLIKSLFHRQEINSDSKFLLDVEKYKQEFLKVNIFQNQTHFFFNIDFGSIRYQYCFIKKYTIKDNIKQILIVKNSNKELINAVIISKIQILVFTIREQQHKLVVDLNTLQQEPPLKLQSYLVDHIILVYQNFDSGSSNKSQSQYKLKVINISNTSMNCNIIKQNMYYYSVFNQKIVGCNYSSCDIYNNTCQVIKNINLLQFEWYQQQFIQIKNIDLIRFPIDKLMRKFVSFLNIKFTNNKTYEIPFCQNGQIFQQNSQIILINQSNSNVCVLHSNLIQSFDKCNNYNLVTCVYKEQCFWNSHTAKCQIKSNQIKNIFQIQVYKDRSRFIQYYSQYLYGRDSTFKNSNKCQYDQNQITTIIRIPNQNDMECFYYRELFQIHQYRINWDNEAVETEVIICDYINQLNCQTNKFILSTPTNYYVNVNHYILIYFKMKKKNSNAQFIQISLTNLERENFAKSIKILSIIFITFFSVIIFSIAIKLLHKKIKLLCVYYGLLQYKPSNKYPLEFLEFKLLIKQYKKKKYIKQYKFISEIQNSKFQPDQNIQECSFCLSELLTNQKIYEIYCKHKYHKRCLGNWMKSEPNSNRCPICKRGFNQQEYNSFQINPRVSHSQI